MYVPLPRVTPLPATHEQGYTLPDCTGLHPAQGYTLRNGHVPLSGEWITEILPGPTAQGYTLRYVYVPLSGEWITEILPCPTAQGYTLPRVTPCVMCMFPFQGNGLRRFCPARLHRVTPCVMGMFPFQRNGLQRSV